jgi:hypothetical protein
MTTTMTIARAADGVMRMMRSRMTARAGVSRRDDDDEDDRPRRRRDDDEDRPRRPKKKKSIRRGEELTGLDATFANTNIVLLILFSCLCSGLALILGLIGLANCTDEKARQNAMISTVIGAIMVVVGIVVRFTVLNAK